MAHEMQNSVCLLKVLCWYRLFLAAGAVILLNILGANSVVVPNSSCYSLDNSSHVVDFTDWVGHPFEFEEKDSDLVVRFCKDVESRSQMGYINFGRFDTSDYFVAGSGNINFVQGFYKGDLLNCERSYDKMGRTAQVNIICGNCRNSKCKGSLGCICDVTYESSCRAIVELAIPCKKHGPRVFEGFTIGFHPHSREIVQNGMTHLGFDKAHREFSFSTEQMHLTLYVTAIASLSKLVQKPTVKVLPEKGLELQLVGSVVAGRAPTTLTPSTLVIDWKCVVAQNKPYEVEITIAIENYEAVQFTLTKMCDSLSVFPCSAVVGFSTEQSIKISMDSMLCLALQLYLPVCKLLPRNQTVTMVDWNLITAMIPSLMNLFGETSPRTLRRIRECLRRIEKHRS